MEDERPIHPMKENDQNIDYISVDKLPVLSEEQLSQENISHELLAKVWVISMLNMKYLIK